MVRSDSFLAAVPKLYSFILVRKESFGGFIFNPYLSDHLPLNEIGMRITELCDGSRTTSEIITALCEEFSLPFVTLKSTVTDALQAFNRYYAIKWRKGKLRHPRVQAKPSSRIIGKGNCLSAPLTVLWDITYACNLKCRHCLASAGGPLKDELNLKEVKRIIDQLADMKVFEVCFLGGEPLMREDFFEILDYASKFNMGISFSTNGMLINNQVMEKLEKLKVFRVQVSLDGLEETHNKIRGVDSFQTAVNAVKKLVKSGVSVGVSTTANELNLRELDALIQLSISLGAASYKAIPFMPVGRGREADNLTLTPEDMKEYVTEMVEKKKKYADQIHIYAEETYSWLLEEPPKPASFTPSIQTLSCVAGTSQLVISPNGLVFPCPFLHEFVAGNLRKEKLSHIWKKSETLALFRKIEREDLKGKCRECPYAPLRCRGGCRAAAYVQTGDLYAEDPMCWYKP